MRAHPIPNPDEAPGLIEGCPEADPVPKSLEAHLRVSGEVLDALVT